ncbi:hypothetical protein B005_0390 [Nocardiopsis alba ATCC BAA-2165]|uniref:Uncharacterized protein n=1 Tax=Nocardiopsis alba (strain ATCC BAA-2165 / BE74) TaxID=1205910 RepID=J7L6P5_NOCAA|nr:hypothetical protein B005_0390 [Nocardiopsis alba ATCC BAA-2165]
MDGCGQGGHSDISCVLRAIGALMRRVPFVPRRTDGSRGPGYDGPGGRAVARAVAGGVVSSREALASTSGRRRLRKLL